MASLKVPLRQSNGTTASTKAVILVRSPPLKKAVELIVHQVGGPSRGTRFRPLSLDLPKVSIAIEHPDNVKLTSYNSLSSMSLVTQSSGIAYKLSPKYQAFEKSSW